MSKYGYIYKTTNLLNNKIYVGQHRSTKFDTWYFGSGKILYKALKKYGKINFKVELLEWCASQELLNEVEIKWISTLNSANPDVGYNISLGGSAAKLPGVLNGMYGKHHTKEVKERLRLLAKQNCNQFGRLNSDYEEKRCAGCKRYSSTRPQSHNDAISRGLTNRKMSEEQREKTRQISKRQWVPGRMTNAMLKQKWMNNGIEHALIHRGSIDEYLNKGYSFGKLKKEVM